MNQDMVSQVAFLMESFAANGTRKLFDIAVGSQVGLQSRGSEKDMLFYIGRGQLNTLGRLILASC